MIRCYTTIHTPIISHIIYARCFKGAESKLILLKKTPHFIRAQHVKAPEYSVEDESYTKRPCVTMEEALTLKWWLKVKAHIYKKAHSYEMGLYLACMRACVDWPSPPFMDKSSKSAALCCAELGAAGIRPCAGFYIYETFFIRIGYRLQ